MFNHITMNFPKLEREEIDGVRYYKRAGETSLSRKVSITSVTSFHNRHIFKDWRKKVGEEVANRINKQATSRGTALHTLVENYLNNETIPEVEPLPNFLFKISKSELDNINNIYALETPLLSEYFGIAGTVDCIAEYKGELAVIDFKTSKTPKPREWIEHYFVQCAAYACMFYELTDIPVKKLVIIMACEDGDCVLYEEYDKMKYIKLLKEYVNEFVQFKLKEYGR